MWRGQVRTLFRVRVQGSGFRVQGLGKCLEREGQNLWHHILKSQCPSLSIFTIFFFKKGHYRGLWEGRNRDPHPQVSQWSSIVTFFFKKKIVNREGRNRDPRPQGFEGG
jgi:hypothetical protein